MTYLTIEAELTEAAWDWIEKFPCSAEDIIDALNSGSNVFLSADGFVAASPLRETAKILAEHYKAGCFVMIGVDTGFVFTRQAIIDGHF